MSYEKVKSIKIDTRNNKVFITSASNNVRPLHYSRGECVFLSNMLKEKGVDAVEIFILKEYESGNLQEGKNKFTQALKALWYVFRKEYDYFDWRQHNAKWGTLERLEEENRRESKEFNELLLKVLNYEFPKNKFLIAKRRYGGELIYGKRCRTCMKWVCSKDHASRFDFKEEAENYLLNFRNLDALVISEKDEQCLLS